MKQRGKGQVGILFIQAVSKNYDWSASWQVPSTTEKTILVHVGTE